MLNKRRKKSPRRKLIEACDKAAREIVRIRDKHTCQRCGRHAAAGWKVEASHFYGRSNLSVRWDLDNLVLLCFKCHYLFAHQNPLEYTEWFREYIGETKMDLLTVRKNTLFRGDLKQELFILKLLKEQYKEDL